MPLFGLFGKDKPSVNPTEDVVKGAAEGLLDGANSILDTVITSDSERLAAKQKLSQVVYDGLNRFYSTASSIIIAEANGSNLQRNWRPLLMLMFGFIILCTYFVFPIVNLWTRDAGLTALIADLKSNADFWGLLKIGMGGYIAGRSLEKISETVTSNIDLSFLRKKDRAGALDKDTRNE